MQSLEALFRKFNNFCFSVKNGREIPLYFIEDIRQEIFNHNPSEALPYINSAIQRLNVMLEKYPKSWIMWILMQFIMN